MSDLSDSGDLQPDDIEYTEEYIIEPINRYRSAQTDGMRSQMADLISVRIITLLLVAYHYDIDGGSNITELWHDDIRKFSGTLPEAELEQERKYLSYLLSSDQFRSHTTLPAFQKPLELLIDANRRLDRFLDGGGYRTFVRFFDPTQRKPTALSKHPDPQTCIIILELLSLIPERLITQTKDKLCESYLGIWVNYVAKYPQDLTPSQGSRRRAGDIVEKWKRCVLAQVDVLYDSDNQENEEFANDNDARTRELYRNRFNAILLNEWENKDSMADEPPRKAK
ncbi:hypothetical protein GMRT_16276 [Giardia muris]|uniref:Uncharacterized protein n=1 Tax=Giardia muris TaxID=5742 RepID=A0A4Z1SUQ4_GIAMU|nr:hypothetical protein GMRT_16276 [Giardia muris]|eukprot:TNJ29622.1 hypothetical protein GMRT_16276 [Giardia muris]